ncbi:hypothetical protein V2O64_24470 (plasmid) [Verrucomicrobiaceae bacterium 227]
MDDDSDLLGRFTVDGIHEGDDFADDGFQSRIALRDSRSNQLFSFIVSARTSSNLRTIRSATDEVLRSCDGSDANPMILVPFLSEDKLKELEENGVSGIDLCGNGVITIPGKLLIFRTGNKNRYPESRPLNNPYKGRSAMVGRMLLKRSSWDSLTALTEAIDAAGVSLSISQVSKTVQALRQDMIVSKSKGLIELIDPVRLLDSLARNWKNEKSSSRSYFKIEGNLPELAPLLNDSPITWSITGNSSLARHSGFTETGPIQIAVSNQARAEHTLSIRKESVPNFSDIELVQTSEPGFFFMTEEGDDGLRYADLIQTWLELQDGDARQQDIASEIRPKILKEIK